MLMAPALRRAVLALHVITSVGWIGAATGYLALGVAAARSHQPETIRAAWLAMNLIGWTVIVPLASVGFITGLVTALGTSWGLVRHYWVLIAFVLTGFALTVLI